MAFPSSTNQDVTKKILEDIQMKKQLLQKGVNSHSPGFGNLYNTSLGFGSLYTPSPLFQLPKYTATGGQPNDSNQSISKGVWSQAINQSFGFFVPQDSLFGNNILPVLPRDLYRLNHQIMACMKLKHLEQYLQTVDDFKEPKVRLEQYQTPPHIASQALYTIQTKYADLEGRLVLDLGCGPGMLSIGAGLLGADFVVGVEIDPDAVEDFKVNCDEQELDNIECFQADVLHLPALWHDKSLFDTVLLNPPFGTKKNSGIDIAFLNVALMLTRGAVYSLHKSATREHIKKKAHEWNVSASLVAQLRYNLPQTYKFHKRPSVDVAVDLWRFERKRRG